MSTPRPVRARFRAGFTMIELVIAVTIFMLVLGSAIPFFRTQSRAINSQAGRSDAVQNTRYSNTVIDRELRLAGGVTNQPIIVQASPFSITFNVDLVSRVANDPDAVYYNPDADSMGTQGWRVANAKALPTVAKSYPTLTYADQSGIPSQAETISFFVLADGSTGRTDDYVLYRRVNDRDSTVIARNLIIPADTAYFFRYWRTNASGTLSLLTAAQQPLYWDAASRWADSIRVVDMRVSALYRDPRTNQDIVRTVYSSTRLLNAGMLRIPTCGSVPLGPQAVTADTLQDLSGQVTQVRVTWTKSLEEAGGERDISLYVVAKRPTGTSDWTELRNLPASNSASYSWDDEDFVTGSWQYGVFAQDCTPANSSFTLSGTVVIP